MYNRNETIEYVHMRYLEEADESLKLLNKSLMALDTKSLVENDTPVNPVDRLNYIYTTVFRLSRRCKEVQTLYVQRIVHPNKLDGAARQRALDKLTRIDRDINQLDSDFDAIDTQVFGNHEDRIHEYMLIVPHIVDLVGKVATELSGKL